MQRVSAALEARQTPRASQRRYGCLWQEPRREAERAVRIAAVAFRRWTARHLVARKVAAQTMGVPERTLAFWEEEWSRNRLRPEPRGRPVERSPVELRNLVIVAFRLMGPQVGVPVLRVLFPDLPRRELEDLTRRYKALHARRRRLLLYQLRWTMPGAVWAIDHAQPPAPVDGLYPAVLAVRDLASSCQLAWLPVQDESAAEVRLALETLLAQHGPPLLIKKDNGGALNEKNLNQMLAEKSVIGLLSPVRTPGYNGSCEAGIGSLRRSTDHQAAVHGRPALWTSDDCEAARLQTNQTARPWGVKGPTPEERWLARPPISAELRERFQRAVRFHEERERQRQGYWPEIVLGLQAQSKISRPAIRHALCACGLLEIRRRAFTLPISP